MFFSSTDHRHLIANIFARLSIFDLARAARVTRVCAAAARREMIARIGQRNHDAMCSTAVTYSAIKYFYRGVTDPAAYWPLALALRRRYDRLQELRQEEREADLATEVIVSMEVVVMSKKISSIISHWIHVGLAGCARLLVQHLHSPSAMETSCEHKIITRVSSETTLPLYIIGALSQESLFWWTLMRLIRGGQRGVAYALRLLDVHHFNLLVDYTEFVTPIADDSIIVAAMISGSRYDSHFARRIGHRFVVPSQVPYLLDEHEPIGEREPAPLDKIIRCDKCIDAAE